MKYVISIFVIYLFFMYPSYSTEKLLCSEKHENYISTEVWDDCIGTEYFVSDGVVYTGEYKDGMINGKGKMTFKNGTVYEGDFVDGQFNGYGKITYDDDSFYAGEFKNNTMNGWGSFTSSEGDVHEGEWVDGELVNIEEDFFGGDELYDEDLLVV